MHEPFFFFLTRTQDLGTASLKPCLLPITDTECQVWAQMVRSKFFGTHPVTVQISIEKIFSTFVFSMTVSTNIIFYFFSKIKKQKRWDVVHF